MTVVDHHDIHILLKKTIGVFVAPQGAERHLQFEKENKRLNLVNQANFSRLIILQLGQGHKFTDLTQIQTELDLRILSLAPDDCVNKKNIPYMSLGTNLHQSELLYQSADKTIFVEDTVEEVTEAVKNTTKEVKRRAKPVKEEIQDIGGAAKELANQVGDVAGAVKGKPRTGRKKKATKK